MDVRSKCQVSSGVAAHPGARVVDACQPVLLPSIEACVRRNTGMESSRQCRLADIDVQVLHLSPVMLKPVWVMRTSLSSCQRTRRDWIFEDWKDPSQIRHCCAAKGLCGWYVPPCPACKQALTLTLKI